MMQQRIVFEDGLMMVMDEDGDGYDAHTVARTGWTEAERKIDEWSGEYRIDVARAKRDLQAYLEEL